VKSQVTSRGLQAKIVKLPLSASNSALAARALSCSLGEIAKSIVFVGARTNLVVISGDRRVDIVKLARMTRDKIRIASAEEVRTLTGYPAGGVPPFPHRDEIGVTLDTSLLRFRSLWAAAGHPSCVMHISIEELKAETNATFRDVAEDIVKTE
jgi:prolyl-tRNA editing enzyme YbaK/EbsC (Cys-tRNA(Pro) deacylase)